FADHGAHRSAHEFEFKARCDDRQRADRSTNDDQCIGLARLLHRFLQALRILAAVLELQRIDWKDFLADLVTPFGIEQRIEPLARADAQVMPALGTDVERTLELGGIEHGLAARAFGPETFGHALARAALLDPRWQKLFDPAHRTFLRIRVWPL